ncbi:hypothetical protein EI71_01837 [Anaeroplasma bactoclasticum]|jgi:hypothetical protein|uniref:Uncharacterized protein n=1 Tax=Anaeroplasma bactoclasticum TaxID=2088 RepID=A0A397QUV7_9MOLU|nr:hypothetical protein [Anaeroplasma bactoclasticum]RIA64848.1 hypothetical protein EI71_01837 [Anaeroplasma bactoclasticum]
MKLLKFILKLILIIVLVVIVGAVIFLIVVSDNSTSDYTPSTEVKSVEQVLGKNIYDSLESISLIDKNDRSTSDNNKITIDISYQELNDCLTDIIRTNGSINNSTYLLPDGTSSITSAGPVSLDSITFQEIDGKFGAIARGSALGFYKTSISMVLSEDPSIVDNVLYLKLGSVKLGQKLNISAGFVKDIFNRFNLFKDQSNEYFDIQELTLKLDLNQQLEKFTSSSRFTDFFKGATFKSTYTQGENAKLSLEVDTKNIFISYDDIPVTPTSYEFDPAVILALPERTLVISEENFNYLIHEEFDTASYNLEPMVIGGYNFTFALDNFYYDLDRTSSKSSILAEVSINNLKTLVEANMTETIHMESGKVKEVVLTVDSLKLGNAIVPNDNFFQEIVITEDSLTNGHSDILSVESVVFDRVNDQVKIKYAPAV